MRPSRILQLSSLLLLTPLWGEAAPPRRIVSLLPSHTEIVTALGAADLLAGVSEAEAEKDYPGIPRVGGLSPQWEMLMVLEPDLILADISHRRYEKDFQRFHLPVQYLASTKADDFDDIFALILEVGKYLERTPAAERLVRSLQERLTVAKARVPPGPGPLVYFEIWPKPLQSCSPASLQGYLLVQAGTRNIVPSMGKDMPLISLEWVPQMAPDIILHTGVVTGPEIAQRPGWGRIPAVLSGRLYEVDRDIFSRAGPTIVEAFEKLLDIVYGIPQGAP